MMLSHFPSSSGPDQEEPVLTNSLNTVWTLFELLNMHALLFEHRLNTCAIWHVFKQCSNTLVGNTTYLVCCPNTVQTLFKLLNMHTTHLWLVSKFFILLFVFIHLPLQPTHPQANVSTHIHQSPPSASACQCKQAHLHTAGKPICMQHVLTP